MIKYIGILSLLFLCGFRMPTMEVGLSGHLRSASHQRVDSLVVFVKGVENNGMGINITDSNGDFGLDFDKSMNDPKPMRFYYVNRQNDTVLLRRVKSLGSDSPEMTFWIK